jgi:hypothetical protein
MRSAFVGAADGRAVGLSPESALRPMNRLAHVPKNSVEGVYNRAEHLERRIELAQAWADLIMADQMPIKDLISLRRLPPSHLVTTARI